MDLKVDSIACLYFFLVNGERVGVVYAEIQSWQSTYYSLLSDADFHFGKDTIEMWIFFNVQKDVNVSKETNDDRVHPGNIYYCAKCTYLVSAVL